MKPQGPAVWTTARKVLGNVLPLVLASPLLVFAIQEFAEHGPTVRLIEWIGAFLVAAWIVLALCGLVGNSAMRREISRRLHIERPFDQTEKVFVGFARPTFRSALDPHEDVGFLIVHADRIEFWGAEHRVSIARGEVSGVRFRANTHTLVGLGGWVSVEAVVDGKPVRLLVEPREKRTLLGNLRFSRRLVRRLREWKGDGPPAIAGSPSESSVGP